MGSAGVAAWAAQVVFAALIVVGVLWGDLGIKRALVFAVLWIAGYFSSSRYGASAALLV
jgi:hypothetical protein